MYPEGIGIFDIGTRNDTTAAALEQLGCVSNFNQLRKVT
jgi:hypothetical protein